MGAWKRNVFSLGNRSQERFLGGQDTCVGPRSMKSSLGEVGEAILGGMYYADKGPEVWKDMTCLGVAEQSQLGGVIGNGVGKAVSRTSGVCCTFGLERTGDRAGL